MLLFTRYDVDGVMTSSNRYLVYKNGESEKLLYSRTFGTALHYRIDLKEWAKGVDYTWSEELLYPAITQADSGEAHMVQRSLGEYVQAFVRAIWQKVVSVQQ